MESSPRTGEFRFPWFWVGAAVLMLGVVLTAVLVQGRKQWETARGSKVALAEGPDPAAATHSLPKQGGPAGYVSSTQCKECHSKQYDTWWRSYHRQMTQAMTTNTVQAPFEGTVMESGGARFTL